MKGLITAALAFIVFSTPVLAREVVNLTMYTDENGKTTVFETTQDVLERCPAWKMDQEPPLPIYKAVELATQLMKEKYPKFTDFDINSISLSKIWDQKYQDRWYYSIGVNANADLDGIKANSYFNVLVLMDGTVVEPISPK